MKWLPNFLTFIRLVLTVPIAFYILAGEIKLTLFLLFIAGVTDILDGTLARHLGARTRLGTWLDPVADKTMITTVLVLLVIRGQLPIWFAGLTIARDLQLILGVLWLTHRGVLVKIQPLLSGKIATVAQNLALLVALLSSIGFPRVGVLFFVGLATAATAFSSAAYGRLFRKLLLTT